jgi:diguanylate cyclase (GGDEF)-like protein
MEVSPVRLPASVEPEGGHTRMLLVDSDHELRLRVAAEATALGLACDTAASTREARKAIDEHPPAIVLLDLSLPTDRLEDAYELLSELSSRAPPIPVLALAGSVTFADRIEVARRGGHAFLSKAQSPVEVLDAALRCLARERLQATRVLLVDDDSDVLEAMGALLQEHDVEVSLLTESLRFWEVLQEFSPELLILDADMPGVNGPELCRVVRNDPRWAHIAVIFVTACTDATTVEEVFRAGADDQLAKPIVATELITRVSNRLERVRLHRMYAETDGLTGLASRAKAGEGLAQLLSLAERFAQPMSLAMLDLDGFKRVNDTHGHAAGDAVLRGFGECLRRDFRGDDVVGRWGGEEFIVGMYGMTREDGVRRLADTLARVRKEQFAAAAGETFGVSFSAGVAEHPLDGQDLGMLIAVADAALYRAKAVGGARVLSAETPTRGGRLLQR